MYVGFRAEFSRTPHNTLLARYLLHLAACALHGAAPQALPEGLSWREVLAAAEHNSIAALTWHAARSCADVPQEVPQEVRAAWERSAQATLYKRLQMDYEREQVCAEMDAAGLAHLPLKGAALSDLYPSPDMRTMADNDILYGYLERSPQGGGHGYQVRGATPEERERTVAAGVDAICRIMERRGYRVLSCGVDVHETFVKEPLYTFELHRQMVPFSMHRACAYYQNPWSRAIADAKPADVPAASAGAGGAGVDNAVSPVDHDVDAAVAGAAMATGVGVKGGVAGAGAEAAGDRAVSGGFHFSAEDNYVFNTLHAFKHYDQAGCGLRFVTDERVMLEAYAPDLAAEERAREASHGSVAGKPATDSLPVESGVDDADGQGQGTPAGGAFDGARASASTAAVPGAARAASDAPDSSILEASDISDASDALACSPGSAISFDWAYVRRQLAELGVDEFEGMLRDLALAGLGAEAARGLPDLSPEQADTAVYLMLCGTYGLQSVAVARKQEQTRRETGRTGLALKLSYVWRRVFPSEEQLKAIHPVAYRHKALRIVLPFYRLFNGVVRYRGTLKAELRGLRK